MIKLKVISRAVVIHDDKLLLVKNHNRDFWSLPGGHWEYDHESIGDCAIRETEEETGYIIELSDILFLQELCKSKSTVVEVFWGASLSVNNKRELHSLKTHVDVDEDSEIEEVAWFSKTDLQKIRVVPESIAKQFVSGKKDSTFIGTFKLSS